MGSTAGAKELMLFHTLAVKSLESLECNVFSFIVMAIDTAVSL